MKPDSPRVAVLQMLLLCCVSVSPALAQFDGEVIDESVSREHCNTFSGETVDVPSRVVLEQLIVNDQLPLPFEVHAKSTYRGRPEVNRGKIAVRSRLVKSGGTVIPLRTLKAKVEDGEAYTWWSYPPPAFDATAPVFEKGDRIRWVAKMKKHPPTDSCWRLEMGILAGGPIAP